MASSTSPSPSPPPPSHTPWSPPDTSTQSRRQQCSSIPNSKKQTTVKIFQPPFFRIYTFRIQIIQNVFFVEIILTVKSKMCGIFVKTFFSYSNPICCSICKLKNVSFDKNEFKTIYITEGFNLLIFLTQILLLISAKSFIKSRKVTVFKIISVLSLFIEAKMEGPQLSLEDIKEIFVLFPSPAYSLPPTSSFLAFQSSYFSFSTSWRSLSRSAFTSSSSTTSSSTFSRTSSSPSSSSEGLTLGCRSCSAQTRGQGRGERSSM